MRIDIVTIFPEYFGGSRGVAPPGQHSGGSKGADSPGQHSGRPGEGAPPGQPCGPLYVSLIGKAAARGDIEFHVHDLRRWAHDIHKTVDDAPFGGGPGMVMKPQVWAEALDEIAPPGGDGPPPRLVLPTPSGVPFTQARAAGYAGCPRLIFACGRYEGIDARFAEDARSRMPVDEVSIGDYVLAGGEAAVLVMVEAVGRLLPGVLGNERSASDDSFGGGPSWDGDAGEAGSGRGAGRAGGMAGLLEGPVYTRPRSWRGLEVPDVLLSGDHAAIERWRRDAALLRTAANRPDLIERAAASPAGGLDARDRKVLREAGWPARPEDAGAADEPARLSGSLPGLRDSRASGFPGFGASGHRQAGPLAAWSLPESPPPGAAGCVDLPVRGA